MIFPSYIFVLVFLPIVLCLWHSFLEFRFKLLILISSSYLFYGWWDYRFVLLLFGTSLIDFFCGEKIYRNKNRKFWLILSMTSNLSSLMFFKYYNFFSESVQEGFLKLNLEVSLPLLNIILPVGISFYTFQSMSYSLDIYRNGIKPAKDLFHFLAYVSLFPQLVAGPIVRYSEMNDQLEKISQKKISWDEMSLGMWFFIIGLSKKCLIADPLSPMVENIFDSSLNLTIFNSWFGSISYTLQLYFDFSGYSDMAVGLGYMLGFKFPINFNSPYKALNISDFWRRWHISLSSFLRDYLFIPLGGSRGHIFKTIKNLWITMFLGGLWHGAAWTFIIWGCYHASLLMLYLALKKVFLFKLPKVFAIGVTFICVNFGWVVFRAPSLSRAREVLEAMIGLNGASQMWGESYPSSIGLIPVSIAEVGGIKSISYVLLGIFIVFFFKNSHELQKKNTIFNCVVLSIAFAWIILCFSQESPFIYFQF